MSTGRIGNVRQLIFSQPATPTVKAPEKPPRKPPAAASPEAAEFTPAPAVSFYKRSDNHLVIWRELQSHLGVVNHTLRNYGRRRREMYGDLIVIASQLEAMQEKNAMLKKGLETPTDETE